MAEEKKKGFFAEFKEFISRGNVMDLAVGMIIGSAFTAIVNSLVNHIVMPIIGVIMGGINFENLKIVITPADEAAGIAEAAICYGSFIQAIVNFLIVALVIFLVVRTMNKFRAKMEAKKAAEEAAKAEAEAAAEEAPTEPEPSKEEVLLTEIRDLLKNK